MLLSNLPLTPLTPLAVLAEPLRLLAQRGELRRYRKGHRLIEEGEHGDTIFILLGGRVRAFGTSDKGREITYGTYGVGEYIGEVSLDGGPRSASVEVIEACECVVITKQTLLRHIAEHPEFALDLIAKLIRLTRNATSGAKQLALNDVYGRLVMLLNELAVTQADGTRLIAARPTHQEMANRLGCSREMVSRLMKDLEAGGYLAVSSRSMGLTKALPTRW